MGAISTSSRLLLLISAATWLICAIKPLDFEAWVLEQVATVFCLAVLIWTNPTVQFSSAAKIGITLVFVIHTIGSHFTYSLTPYDAFSQDMLGFSINEFFGWQRNHYDRFVHLAYGAFLTLPLSELFSKIPGLSLTLARFLAFNTILSSSAAYELLEWLAAVVFGGETGTLYLGTQGDVWDPQADIALAALGSVMTIALMYAVQRGKSGPHEPAR